MNEERPIEKKLRRYAEQRRTNAGAPLELHPATRRLLQGEVVRRYGRPDAAPPRSSWRGILQNFWPRLVWAVPVLLVVFLGVWMWRQGESETTEQFGLVAKDSLAPKRAAPLNVEVASAFQDLESPPAPAAIPPPPTLRPESTFAPTEDKLGGALAFKSETSVGVAVVTPAEAHAGAVRGRAGLPVEDEAKPNVFYATRPATSAAPVDSRDKSSELAVATRERGLTATGTFTAAPPLARGGGLDREETRRVVQPVLSQSFANVMPAQEAVAKQKAAAVVLANFRIVQTGDEVRVVDSDGSTYTGTVIAASLGVSDQVETPESSPAAYGRTAAPDSATRRLAAAPGAAPVPTQTPADAHFRVSGTNRTLNQQVVFTWNYVAPSNAVAAAQMETVTDGQQRVKTQVSQQFPALLQNSGISGRAQLNGGPEIYINAVPVEK